MAPMVAVCLRMSDGTLQLELQPGTSDIGFIILPKARNLTYLVPFIAVKETRTRAISRKCTNRFTIGHCFCEELL